jgi:hemerythrin-like domain-containing protein
MTVTKATTVLQQEHQTIRKVVATTSLAADQLEAEQNLDCTVFGDTITFLRDLSEECHHHAKEERFLPPLLEARGITASGCPIAVLHNEHKKGRGLLLAQLDEATQRRQGCAGHDLASTSQALRGLHMEGRSPPAPDV